MATQKRSQGKWPVTTLTVKFSQDVEAYFALLNFEIELSSSSEVI